MQLILLLKDDSGNGVSPTDAFIPDTLMEISKRLEQQPMNSVIKRILFTVFLSCMVSNFKATFTYLEAHGLTDGIIEETLKNASRNFDCSLERKLYSMALTSLLTQNELPD